MKRGISGICKAQAWALRLAGIVPQVGKLDRLEGLLIEHPRGLP